MIPAIEKAPMPLPSPHNYSLIFILIVSIFWGTSGYAAKITEEVALQANGFDIPIIVVTPDEGTGPFPLVYHVHGGGWNGGTDTTVPEPSVPSGYRFLTDQLGVIHVGLAYRGKRQGTFAKAMEDLRASIKWFEANAADFQADLTRVGLSGGSAGTPLSSLLAQEIPTCKTYVGFYGVYDLLSNEESLFPNEEARFQFGLSSEAEKRAASAAHNLRESPPASLLFHGGKDILTHPSQSLRFATTLQARGAFAESIIYPEINHGFFSERYPEAYTQSLLRVARLYQDYLGIENAALNSLESRINRRVAGYLPSDEIDPTMLRGTWTGKNESWTFADASRGVWSGPKKAQRSFAYNIVEEKVIVRMDGAETVLYLQRDGRALYKITENDDRRNGQRFHFKKEL